MKARKVGFRPLGALSASGISNPNGKVSTVVHYIMFCLDLCCISWSTRVTGVWPFLVFIEEIECVFAFETTNENEGHQMNESRL